MIEILHKMNPNKRFWIVIRFALLISLIELMAQYNLKKNKLYLGIIGYAYIAYILTISYNYEGFGHMNLVWSCVSIITCYILGYYYFNENINKYTIIAILFSLFAIYFAHRADENNFY